MAEAKPFEISKHSVFEAYKRVYANRGAHGVDGVSWMDFHHDLRGNLYKIWNRMSSGSYFPPPVRRVEIPKGKGSTRPLGIPTVSDRIAQAVVKAYLEPLVEPMFHPDSYGYRPGRSAHDALGVARKRCWRRDWVVDLDIQGFFDNLAHELVMRAVRHHTDERWICLYVERWLKAPVQHADGTLEARTKGVPQGGVLSPLLANLFLHYALDHWLARHHPDIQFERYADDVVLHCASLEHAQTILEAVRQRLAECQLELHPEKTQIVYCKDDDRPLGYANIAFDFLGFTFRPRLARNRWGKFFVSFLPAISCKAASSIRATIRGWSLARHWTHLKLEDVAQFVNPFVRGWLNYYGRFYRSAALQALRHLNRVLSKWVRRKYHKYRRKERAADHWLGHVARRDRSLFVLWQAGVIPSAGR